MGDIGKPIRETERPAPVPAPAPRREPAPADPQPSPVAPPGERETEPVEGAQA
jgi:hypothetical protein